MKNQQICDFIIFGGNGDLAKRKLLPALYYLQRDDLLGRAGRIVAIARTELETGAYRQEARTNLEQRLPAGDFDSATWDALAEKLHYQKLDASKPEDYARLDAFCREGGSTAKVFYLAVPPTLFPAICENLASSGLMNDESRVVLEKPLGNDLESAQLINRQVRAFFKERQTFRIDHYLGKETVQNLLALRFANRLFEPIWNSGGVAHVQITAAETIGVEGRSGYYDNFGAMRDMVQNHLMQLLCLIAMEVPGSMDADAVRDEKLKVLRSLRRIEGEAVSHHTVRGQYEAGTVDEESVPGYLEGHGTRAESRTETFVALKAFIDNWRWSGVPFYLRTGKRLRANFAEVIIQFRNVPHSIFGTDLRHNRAANRLVLRLQPEETIKLMLLSKIPGVAEGIRMKPVALNLNFKEAFDIPRTPGAYARLLLDVLRNDPTLFVRGDESEEAWRWVDRIFAGWNDSGQRPLPYAAGSWGPDAADELIRRDGRTWGPPAEVSL